MEGKEELLLKLHEQFSVNQNDTFGRYITLFIALFALFGAYGIAFGLTTTLITFGDYEVSPVFFLFLSTLLTIILGFLNCSLIYFGYQHRRDQFMNGKIRRYFFMGNEKDQGKAKKQFEHFFKSYQGNNKGFVSFIPDNILLNISILGILKIIILFCMFFVSFQSFSCPIRAADCKAPPVSKVIIDTPRQQSVVLCNNQNFNGNFQAEKINGLKDSDISTTMIYSLIGVLAVYTICFLVWVCFYKKYKKLEKDYNQTNVDELLKLFKEEGDMDIKQELKDAILKLLKSMKI